MEIPPPTLAARPTRKVVQGSWVAKAVAKIGASVETDPSISPASPGCTQVRMNRRCAVRSSRDFSSSPRCSSIRASARAYGPPRPTREVAEKLARFGVRGARGGAFVERLRIAFHEFGFLAHALETEVLASARRAAGVVAGGHARASEAGMVSPKRFAVKIDEPAAMAVLLRGHALEDRGGGRVVVAQPLGVGAVDPRVILLSTRSPARAFRDR